MWTPQLCSEQSTSFLNFKIVLSLNWVKLKQPIFSFIYKTKQTVIINYNSNDEIFQYLNLIFHCIAINRCLYRVSWAYGPRQWPSDSQWLHTWRYGTFRVWQQIYVGRWHHKNLPGRFNLDWGVPTVSWK